MKQLRDVLTSRRFLFILVAIAGAVTLLLFFSPTTSTVVTNSESPVGNGLATKSGTGITIAVGLVLSAFLASIALLLVILTLSGSDSESDKIARQITSTPTASALLERWLRRSRFYRFIGGLVAFIASTAILDERNDGLSPLLFVLLSGVALGGALAEVHVLRRRQGTEAAADLTVRAIRDFTDPVDLAAMACIALAGATTLIATAFGWSGAQSVWWAIGSVAVVGAVLGFQYLVARRSRPALRPELRDADDLLRFLAATQGFARPAIAVAFFMLANALKPEDSSSSIQLFSMILIILGLVWWYRGRHGRIPQLAQARMAA